MRDQSALGPPRAAGQAGFSMVELLIAIVVLVVGVVAVAQLVPTAIQSNTRNRYDSTALILAQRQLELMVQQGLRAGGPLSAPGNHYFFCVPPADLPLTPTVPSCPDLPAGDYFVYNLGLAPLSATNATPLEAGASLLPSTLEIDWSQSFGAVPDGYKNRFVISESGLVGGVGQALGGNAYESRWNVFTVHADLNGFAQPVAKRITISVRGGPAGVVQRPATITTWVADR